MDFFQVLLLALGLGADAFSVALGVGCAGASARQLFRLSWHFGLFQFLMPLLGWQMGYHLRQFIAQYDHWVAFGLLSLIGTKMLWEAFHPHPDEKTPQGDPTRGWSLVFLSLATSLDALGAGIGMAFMGGRLLPACLLIGIVAGLMTLLGMKLGGRVSQRLGQRCEACGGVVLLVLAVKMLAI